MAITITISSASNNQQAIVGTNYGVPFVVTVLDGGSPIAPRPTMLFGTPGGSGPKGTFPGGAATYTQICDGAGNAQADVFTANGVTGHFAVDVSILTSPTNIVFIDCENIATPPVTPVATTLSKSSGDGQSAFVSTDYTNPVAVLLLDQNGLVMAGVTITFTITGSATFTSTGTTSQTAVTNSSGIATTSIIHAGATAGAVSIAATVAALSTTFNLTNVPFVTPPASTGMAPLIGIWA